MSDTAAAVRHYRYAPEELPAGVYQTPHAGEVCTGEIIEVPAAEARIYADDPDWQKASQKEYDKQGGHADLVAELQQPHDEEEE